MTSVLDKLNDKQLEAARMCDGALLVLAGAGSGKTRMLTARIARLIVEDHVEPWRILAVTFTNKAAREMRERLLDLDPRSERVWCSTFHSLCVRILRKEAQAIGYERSFSIYDDEDATKTLKTVIAKAKLDENTYPPKFVKAEISKAKDGMIPPPEFLRHYGSDFRGEKLALLYSEYQKALREAGAMDFDDLILNTLMLFKQHPDILESYSNRFRYIHVDEYQDTSQAQYMLIRLLSGVWGNICVVGDDDQSIYGWRGADIRNILDFEKDYPGARVVRLEQNYRSTSRILDAANSVIANNMGRKEKKLWTENPEGKKPLICSFADAEHEADFVAGEITRLVREEKRSYSECAIFYRTHAQSRLLGQSLVRAGIPYRVYGGVGFWQRKEIKDVMAYLKLLSNADDTIAFRRIINIPKRGIGDTTVDAIEALAVERTESMLAAAMDFEEYSDASSRAKKAVAKFAELMGELSMLAEILPIDELIDQVITKSGILSMYPSDDEEDASRRENIRELTSAAKQFISEWESGVRLTAEDPDDSDPDGEPEDPTLEDWLSSVSLESDIGGDEVSNSATLMTVHGAKGLEFPIVFATGLEEGTFPHMRSLGSDSEMEEERRLCYVAITRARELLYITYANTRQMNGQYGVRLPSRFLKELPSDGIEYGVTSDPDDPFGSDTEFSRTSGSIARAVSNPNFRGSARSGGQSRGVSFGGGTARGVSFGGGAEPVYKTGDHVRHDTFGDGVVVNSAAGMVTVAFEGRGIKQLSIAYAKLQKKD